MGGDCEASILDISLGCGITAVWSLQNISLIIHAQHNQALQPGSPSSIYLEEVQSPGLPELVRLKCRKLISLLTQGSCSWNRSVLQSHI